MISNNDLVFPVLVFHGPNVAGIARDAESPGLGSGTPEALKRGHFNDLQIIDMGGKKFTVKAAKKIGIKKPWWSLPLFFTLINVSLELEESGCIGLEELKQRLLKVFKADRRMWESIDLTYAQFAADLGKCMSFREVAEYVGKF